MLKLLFLGSYVRQRTDHAGLCRYAAIKLSKI
jgi:hypothetical protein